MMCRSTDETGVGIVPSPCPAQAMAKQKILTPSRVECGPGGRFAFEGGGKGMEVLA